MIVNFNISRKRTILSRTIVGQYYNIIIFSAYSERNIKIIKIASLNGFIDLKSALIILSVKHHE